VGDRIALADRGRVPGFVSYTAFRTDEDGSTVASMAMAIVIISSADSEGAGANPIVTRAVASASAGPFLVSAMDFAAFLMPAGLLTLQSGVFGAQKELVGLREDVAELRAIVDRKATASADSRP
jgi:hypothetical protein